jgi:hypothetical protein
MTDLDAANLASPGLTDAVSVIRELAGCDSREDEYWTHVSAQEELPVAGEIAPVRPPERLDRLVGSLPADPDETIMESVIAAELLRDPRILEDLRLLVSVSDKRCYLDLSYLFSRAPDPTHPGRTLCGCPPQLLTRHQLSFFRNLLLRAEREPARANAAAATISKYLVVTKGLSTILRVYGNLGLSERDAIVKSLVLPGEAQQREAKRRGHGVEAALAELVDAVGCTVVPADKAKNPMGSADPNVDPKTFQVVSRDADRTSSFDLLILDSQSEVRVCIQSLVQSSDPGQFGVEKAKDTRNARSAVDLFNRDPDRNRTIELWGLLDGVGYSENKNGTINRLLRDVHEFVQLKSLYKAALALHRLGLATVKAIEFDPLFYRQETRLAMSLYVPEGVAIVTPGEDVDGHPLQAGCAKIYM